MNSYFNLSEKIFDVTERYPQLIDILATHGFENLRNDAMRQTIGKTISLETALISKHLDPELFERMMVEAIEQDGAAAPANAQDSAEKTELRMAGVLPCPIRIQLLEKLDEWLGSHPTKVHYDLYAASMGLDWLRDQIVEGNDASDLADVYLSAGFSLFFDRNVFGKFLQEQVFTNLAKVERLNPCFDNEQIDLKDPLGQYSIIGVVPAIFMVNTDLLGDRPFPHSWADLLTPEFENTMALPMQDLDLFNAVLLGIYKEYGEDGVRKLGRGLMRSMHPAQMIKNGNKKGQDQTPLITVMPYFFSWMAKEGGPMKAVWPSDGAIISPILLLTKDSSKELSQPLVDFLFSKEMGQVFSADGKFPSTQPEVDNGLSPEQKFMWLGWDFIHSHNIGELLQETEQLFYDSVGGK